LLEKQASNHQAAAELLERAKDCQPHKGARTPIRESLHEGGRGKSRHRKVARRKDTESQVVSSENSITEGRPRLSFEASVQALKDSFKPTVHL
jgi:hypothetical protein